MCFKTDKKSRQNKLYLVTQQFELNLTHFPNRNSQSTKERMLHAQVLSTIFETVYFFIECLKSTERP